jgi:hypothetical protein
MARMRMSPTEARENCPHFPVFLFKLGLLRFLRLFAANSGNGREEAQEARKKERRVRLGVTWV